MARLLILDFFCSVNHIVVDCDDCLFVFWVKFNVICYSKVRMKFSRDFINAIDGTGRQLLAFNNVSIKRVYMLQCIMNVQYMYLYRSLVLLFLQRPGSSGSLLSGGLSSLQKPQTANLITLPTVCSPQPDNKAGDKDLWCLSPAPDQRNAGGERADNLGLESTLMSLN